MGPEAQLLVKKISEKMSHKTGNTKHETMGFIRKRIQFDLLRTTIIALRGFRGKKSGAEVEVGEVDINLEPFIGGPFLI